MLLRLRKNKGDLRMPETVYLKEAEKFEIQAYKRPKDIKSLRKTHVSFSGSPQKHPYDSEKVIIVADPYSTQNTYYEFYKDDISYVEELPNIVDLDGQTVTMVRIWIKKLSVGVRCSPFLVDEIGNKA
jgi:inorganic pyrophosphatase